MSYIIFVFKTGDTKYTYLWIFLFSRREFVMSRKSTGVKQTVKFTAAKAAETVKEAENTVKEVASKTAEAAKETVKVASEKAAEVKETAKEESKKVADKATETKDTVKKAVKKTAAKVTEKKNELVSEVYVQFAGQEAKVDAVIERATQAYVADGHRASSIKSLQVYLKPEESAAYYVINSKYAGKVDLF